MYFTVSMKTKLTLDYFKYQKYFLTGKYPQIKCDAFCSSVGRRTSQNYENLGLRVRDRRLLLLNQP